MGFAAIFRFSGFFIYKSMSALSPLPTHTFIMLVSIKLRMNYLVTRTFIFADFKPGA